MKYKIADKVFIWRSNSPTECKVISIMIDNDSRVFYKLSNSLNSEYIESSVFASLEDLKTDAILRENKRHEERIEEINDRVLYFGVKRPKPVKKG